jgi:hypothetical protein
VSQSPGWSTYSHYPSVPPPRLIHPSILPAIAKLSRPAPTNPSFLGVSQSSCSCRASTLLHLSTPSGPLASLSTLSRRPTDSWTLDTPSTAGCLVLPGVFAAASSPYWQVTDKTIREHISVIGYRYCSLTVMFHSSKRTRAGH